MDRVISLKAAIDALDMIGSVDTDADREYAREVFMSLPSAQPQWIPCSERLPEVSKEPYYVDSIDGEKLFESDRVLVFGKSENGYDYAVASHVYSTASGDDWSGAYDAGDIELMSILAWMPLPEPWKGEQP